MSFKIRVNEVGIMAQLPRYLLSASCSLLMPLGWPGGTLWGDSFLGASFIRAAEPAWGDVGRLPSAGAWSITRYQWADTSRAPGSKRSPKETFSQDLGVLRTAGCKLGSPLKTLVGVSMKRETSPHSELDEKLFINPLVVTLPYLAALGFLLFVSFWGAMMFF